MRIAVENERFNEFAERAKGLDGWLHHYNFNDNLITGYYKYQGIGADTTIAGRGDPDFDRLQAAYLSIDHSQLQDCIADAMDASALSPPTSSALELGASSGQLAFWLTDMGFGEVVASEIRSTCCDQIDLIRRFSANTAYRDRVVVRNDMQSIDHPDFPEKFGGKKFDIVVCSRTLNHLANPIQAIRNMAKLSKGFVFIYCQTMINPLPSRLWSVSVPQHVDLTSSIESVNVTPHYRWLADNANALGFSGCTLHQPPIFSGTLSPFINNGGTGTRLRLVAERAVHAMARVRLGHMKAFAPALMRSSGLNASYIGYLLRT